MVGWTYSWCRRVHYDMFTFAGWIYTQSTEVWGHFYQLIVKNNLYLIVLLWCYQLEPEKVLILSKAFDCAAHCDSTHCDSAHCDSTHCHSTQCHCIYTVTAYTLSQHTLSQHIHCHSTHCHRIYTASISWNWVRHIHICVTAVRDTRKVQSVESSRHL